MDVLLTGAHGTVGTALRNELGDRYALRFTDVAAHPEVDTHVADMTDYDSFRAAFEGVDAVVHLALDPTLNWTVIDVEWSDALARNLAGTVNAFRAAMDAGVERLLFASTIHTVGGYEAELAPDIYDPDHDLQVDHTACAPDSLYAVAKLFGEALGRFCADRHGLRCYLLRLGRILPVGHDHPYRHAEGAVESGEMERGSPDYERLVRRSKADWCSHRDLADLVDRCLGDDSVTCDTFYAVSDNARRWVDIDHARESLGYDPVDDGDDFEGPPDG